MSELKKPFVYVKDEDIDSFTSTYIDPEVEIFGVSDKYEDKIIFLGSTGKMYAKGNYYGDAAVDEIYVGSEENIPEGTTLFINIDEDDEADTYSKSELNYLIQGKANNKRITKPVVTTQELSTDKYYIWGTVAELTITLPELTTNENDLLQIYMFQFNSGTTPTSLSIPANLKWATPKTIEANKTYQVIIINGIVDMKAV